METNNEKIEQIDKEAKAFVKNFIEKFNISTDGDFDKINLELHQVLKDPIATKEEVFYAENLILKNWKIKNGAIFIFIELIVNLLLFAICVIFMIKIMPLNDKVHDSSISVWVPPILIAGISMFTTIILMKINTKLNDNFYKYKLKKFADKLIKNNPALGRYKDNLEEQKSKKQEFLIRAYKEMEENKK
ncbi:hypothetical protein N4T42_02170 [Riemerella anatipestifer]|uniref:hypothetical protein n=1 Tax=Riemerella anatipestifer TaxID=34085 RepID=UPI0021D5B28E|nr:hypothetical protein [Riemerella anatipestifer]MCU7559108.1 hypothetical protein [Riemerella anatipestifer]MDY3400680.1 hypothetical protein [Riemerella anatipestifer]